MCTTQLMRATLGEHGSMMDRGLHRLLLETTFCLYGDRMEFRAREVAAVSRARRILRTGDVGGTAGLWVSLAGRYLSHTRRERVVWILWQDAEEAA